MKPFRPQSNRKPFDETFALRVTGYDLEAQPEAVLGIHDGTGEEIRVTLRPAADDKEKASFVRRNPISKIAAPRKKVTDPSTEVGGLLLVERGVKQADGSFAARWIKPLASMAEGLDRGHVFRAVASMTPIQHREYKGEKKRSAAVTFFMNENIDLPEALANKLGLIPPAKIEKSSEIAEMLEAALAPRGFGELVAFRVTRADKVEMAFLRMGKDDTPDGVVKEFMASSLEQSDLDAIDNGECVAEVIVMGRVEAGLNTLDQIEKNDDKVREVFTRSVEGRDYPEQVYRNCLIVIRDREGDKHPFMTHVEPLGKALGNIAEAIKALNTGHAAPTAAATEMFEAGEEAMAAASEEAPAAAAPAAEKPKSPIADAVRRSSARANR